MDWKMSITDMNTALRNLNGALPETSKAFSALAKVAKERGALDEKTKEFIALAISIADRCEPCIGFHVKALVRLGASRQEVAEVLGVAVQMGGGPSLMYSAKALDAFDQLSAAPEASAV